MSSHSDAKSRKRLRVAKSSDQKIYQMVKSTVENRIETKNYTIPLLGTSVRAAPNGLSIPLSGALATGAGNNQRVGNSVTFTSIKYDLFFSAASPQQQVGLYNNLRMIVYVSRQPNVPMTGLPYNSPVDSEAYFVIRDFFIPLGSAPTGTATTRRQGWIKFPRGKKVIYNDGLQNSETKNKMLCYIVSDAAAAQDAPVVNGSLRLYYKDA